jgi:chitinase
VKVSHVNLMTMDFGDNFGGQPLAPVVTGALNDGNKQIQSLMGLSKADAWRVIGVIPMIGQNDDSEVFSLSDAKSLASFAKQNQLGLVSFWSIDRDQVCQGGADSSSCSTVDKSNFAFHKILKAVTQ